MLIRIIKFMSGYLRIRVEGYSPERFLNLCAAQDILVWNLEHHKEGYELYISVRGFKQLRPILRKTKTRVRILRRYGMPFFLHKYRKRKMFFAGIVLSFAIIYALSLFVWDIQIEGNSVRTDTTLLDYLQNQSIYYGIRKDKVDCEAIETLLRGEFNDIIWASVELKGTCLIVHVQESLDVESQNIQDDTQPTDLCADKDGIVSEIITRKGTPLVLVGDAVSAGAILVQGRIEILSDYGEVSAYRYCNSDADIFLETEYFYEDSFSIDYEKKVYTGEEKKEFHIKFFSKALHVRGLKVKSERYDTVVEEAQMKLWENFYLPFYLGRTTHKEYTILQEKHTQKSAEKEATEKLNEYCNNLKKKGVQILENSVKIQIDEKVCLASGTIKVIEKTGTVRPTEILEITKPQEEQNIDEHN